MTINQNIKVSTKNIANTTRASVPVGCVQTEFGVIPVEWEVITIDAALLKKYLEEQMDGNHGELYPKSHEFSSFGIPYVGATDFYTGRIDFKNCKYLPIHRAKKFKKGVSKNGDVLFAHNATVGPVAIVDADSEFIIISTTATYYRCNKEKINNAYLASYFRSDAFVKQFSSVMSQSTRNQVPILAQRKFSLILPRVEEQNAIANALSDVDALICELEKLIAKKQAIKTATMQQLLTGRTRLPQFALRPDGTPKGYKQTELGEIPEDWDVVELGSTCKVQGGYAFKSEKFSKQGTAILRISNIQSGLVELDEVVFCSRSESIPQQFHVNNGDALIAMSGATTGKVGIYKSANVAFLNQRVGKFVVHESSNNVQFVQQVVMSYLYRELLLGQLEQGAQPNVSSSQLEKIKIRLPLDSSEQSYIANALSDMDSEIQSLELRLSKTRQIKQGMMQELLTGKTRLIKPQEQVA